MGWRIVKQPNGLYARWSDIVDDFTHMNMSRAQALLVCREELGRLESEAKVSRAEARPSRHLRWAECIQTLIDLRKKKAARAAIERDASVAAPPDEFSDHGAFI